MTKIKKEPPKDSIPMDMDAGMAATDIPTDTITTRTGGDTGIPITTTTTHTTMDIIMDMFIR